jgi:hypothetical protein
MVDFLARQVRTRDEPLYINDAIETPRPCPSPVDITLQLMILNTLTGCDLTHTLKDFRLLRGSNKTYKILFFFDLIRNNRMCLNFLGLLNDSIKLLCSTFKQSNFIQANTVVQALLVRNSENTEFSDLIFILDQLKEVTFSPRFPFSIKFCPVVSIIGSFLIFLLLKDEGDIFQNESCHLLFVHQLLFRSEVITVLNQFFFPEIVKTAVVNQYLVDVFWPGFVAEGTIDFELTLILY